MKSRYSTDPIIKDGHVVGRKDDTPGDLIILSLFAKHGCLTALDVCEYTGRPYHPVIRRLRKLKRQPFPLITVHATQRQDGRAHLSTSLAYHLTKQGEAYLLERGIEPKQRPSSHFFHGTSQSQLSLSFELGCKLKNLKWLQLEEKPIPVTFSLKGTVYDKHRLTPDGPPIGIGYGNDDWRFFVTEVDGKTEPLQSANRDRQAIEMKFAAYLSVLGQGIYESHYDIPNLHVLFTTTSEVRMNDMRKLLASMTSDFLDCFGFQVFKGIRGERKRPGWAVLEPWHTATKHTLNLGALNG